jgi:hypothetical protein
MIWVILIFLGIPLSSARSGSLPKQDVATKAAGQHARASKASGRTRWIPGHAVSVHVLAFRASPAAWKPPVWVTAADARELNVRRR